MHTVDWYPTFIHLAGGTIHQSTPIDGLDVWPMITQQQPSPHDAILSVSTRGPMLSAIRMGHWKLIVLDADATLQKSKAFSKYEPLSLFNLLDDPSESVNVAAQYPDRVHAMRQKLAEMLKGAVASGAKGNEVE
jgi:arylsulfatase A-like enzyme